MGIFTKLRFVFLSDLFLNCYAAKHHINGKRLWKLNPKRSRYYRYSISRVQWFPILETIQLWKKFEAYSCHFACVWLGRERRGQCQLGLVMVICDSNSGPNCSANNVKHQQANIAGIKYYCNLNSNLANCASSLPQWGILFLHWKEQPFVHL